MIDQSASYQSASKLVHPPNAGFAYLDLKAVFERSYGTLRPLVAMSLAFNPEAGRYIDASKLPATETISRHLGPSIYSQSVSADGTLIESVGPLTLPQVLLGTRRRQRGRGVSNDRKCDGRRVKAGPESVFSPSLATPAPTPSASRHRRRPGLPIDVRNLGSATPSSWHSPAAHQQELAHYSRGISAMLR